MKKVTSHLSKTNIPKLDDSNYMLWSSRMRAYFRSKDLYKVCTGKKNPVEKKQHKMANILISHLGDSVFDSVINANNEDKPALIWTAITNCFASLSVNNKARV